MQHDCIKIAIEKITGLQLDLVSHPNRGFHPTEVAEALWKEGWSLTIFFNESQMAMDDGSVEHFEFSVDPRDYDPCMIDMGGHALALIDDTYWDGNMPVPPIFDAFSIWVPRQIKS